MINLSYNFSLLLFCLGLYVVFASKDRFKKLFGLSIFQTSVLWFYVSLSKIYGAQPPICSASNCLDKLYSNPLPHVLMLTAIVVGIATLAVGFSLLIRIETSSKI
jgi:multicomponent Na+:H+ antiporter subunit C